MYHIIANPAAGMHMALPFLHKFILPLLNRLREPYHVWTTTGPKYAGEIAQTILSGLSSEVERTKIMIVGGDGTMHEFIEGIKRYPAEEAGSPKVRWEFIIIPMGTANALGASLVAARPIPPSIPSIFGPLASEAPEVVDKLSSLSAAYDNSNPSQLSTMTIKIYDSNGQETSDGPMYSHVVTSTALHATILQTSEELRAEHPGIERFKIAAERALGVFFDAHVRLLPAGQEGIKQYDPKTAKYIEPFTTDIDNSLEGPFSYFLGTTVCDRLEPTFVINPTVRTHPVEAHQRLITINVLRPLRDPDVRDAAPAARADKWKSRANEVFINVYKDGKHLDLLYPEQGGETKVGGEGQVAVETFRVGGFEWTPTRADQEASHLVCADGAIRTIPKGGRARVTVDEQEDNGHSFWVYG